MKTDILTTAADSFTGMPVDTPAENDAGNVFADGSNDFADEEKARRRAQMKAAAKTLFRTDISKMDDAAVAGFYTACARGLFGIEDPDGRVAFGRRAGDARANVGLLRDFCNGNYSVIRDPEYDKWAAMDEERKFRYALEHEGAAAKTKGWLAGNRGATLKELAGAGMPGAQFGNVFQNMAAPNRDETVRRVKYENLTPEEQQVYRDDVIGRFEDKLSKRQVLATYLAATEGLSDRAAMLLANTYNGLQKQDRDNPYFYDKGTVDVDAVEALPDDEKDRFYTALAIMRGDRKKGHLLFMPTDFSDDTALNRAQLALYGLQTSVLDLFSDTYAMGRDAARWTYAKTVMGDEARKNYFRRWDAEQRAQRVLEQGLPEADSWIGEMVQSLGENSHWFIPYGAIAKGGGLVKAGKAAKATAALRGEVAGIQKAAAQAGAAASGASLGEVGRAAARSGMMTGPGVDLWKRQMAAVEHFTQELRAAGDAARKADTMRKSGRALWTAGQASAFSAFSEEYIANCDAAGISREESVPMSAIVGLVNAKVEQLYVPGLESSLTPVQVKSLMLASGLRAFRSEGAAGFRKWAANYVAKGVSEGVKVTLSEGAVEEPIQQLVTEWGKEIAKSADELRERGWGGIALAWGKFIHDNFAADGGFENFVRNGLGTYVDTAVDMVPSSVGFGLTTNFNAKMGQRRRNRARRRENLKKWEAAKQYALANGREEPVLPRMLSHDASGRVVFNPDGVDYDEGVADVVARAMETRNAIGAYWESKGDTDARAGNRLVQAVTDARAIWRDGDGDKLGRIAETVGVDQKTAEVVCQYLEAESEAEAYSPNVRAWTSINLSSADISEDTIRSVLPGYVDGSFMADAEGGTYAARVRLADGTERTIAYRVGDISAELMADVAENEKEDSAFGRSYDARMKQGAEGAARTWASLSDAERHRIAVEAAARVNGFSSGRAGVLEMKDADGRTVRVNADDVIYLASGRLADVGYSAMAHMGTARHETFHALWRFAATSYTDVQLQEMARTLGVDTASDTWRVDLDEAMAHQMEEYASGHYVTHVAETQLGKLLDSGAAKFIDVLSRFGLGDEVVNAKTGRPFALADFYDAVLRGEIGSGATGVEHVATDAHAPKAESSAAKGAGVPMEVSEEDRAAVSADLTAAQAAEQETAAENAPAAPVNAESAPVNAESAPVNAESAPVNAESAPAKAAPKAGGSLDNPADASVTDARFYRIGAGEGVDIVGELVVSDARDLKTSYKGTLEDASLQNRGDTEEGRALVEKIAARPDPLQVGTVQPRANNGFIWATPSGNVFIGNTRESGITKAYERGNAENVRAYMLAEAQRRGLEVPEGCGQPVVHFVLRRIESADGSATIQDVVRMTNESVNRGMNVYETARNDADVLVGNNLVPGIALRPDGLVDTDRSADAIGSFRRLTNAQGMIDENTGMLTEEGQTRLSNAVLAALLGNGNADLLRKIVSESARLDIENEKRALMRCAAELMDLAAKKPEFDLRQPLAEALRYYVEWRDADETRRAEAGKSRHDWYARTKDGARRRGLAWADHMAQQDMFRTPSADAKLLGDLLAASRDLRSFEADDRETEAGKQRAQRLVADYIGDYIRNARAVNTETVDMFGTPPASRTDVLEAQRTRDGRRRFSMNVSDETKHYFASRHDTSSWTIRKEPSEVLAMQTVEFGDVQPLSEKTDNRSVRTALKDLFRADDPVLNEESNEKAVFPGSIAGKLMSQSGADMNRIGRLLKPLFKSAVLSWTEPEMKMDGHTFHFENKGYRMFVNKFRVGGDVEMFVRFTVRDQKGDGSRMALHHATVSDVELYKESAADSHPVDKTGDDRAFVDYKLAKFFAPVHGESKVGVRTPPASRTGAFDAANPDIRFSIAERHDELMRSSAEYRDVYDRYHDADGSAKPGWLKAPNGRDTNLEPYQWVQVRTPSFMRWFGDWIKNEVTKRWFDVAKADVVTGLAPVDVSSFGALPDKKSIANAFRGFGIVTNSRDGRSVRFPANSAGKMVYQKQFAAAFGELFKTAVRAWSEKENPVEGHKPHANIENFHSYVNKFTDGRREFYVRFTVRESKDEGSDIRDNVHAAEISDVSVYQKTEASPLPNNQTGRRDASDTGRKPHVDRKISYFLEGIKDDSSKIVDENGEPRILWHGTNWNPLKEKNGKAVFDERLLGTASGDNGFFGRGHYFAYTEGEASFYGRNVIPAFLRIENPFDYEKELATLWGKRTSTGMAGNLAPAVNLAEKFPEIANGFTATYRGEYVEDQGYELKEISLVDFAKEAERIRREVKFEVVKIENSNDIVVRAEPHKEKHGGFEWTEYRYEQRFYNENDANDELLLVYDYLENIAFPGLELPKITDVMQTREFTDAIKAKGHDGVIQSENGDEAVVFDSNQVKSADANNGDFSRNNDDVRYSIAGIVKLYNEENAGMSGSANKSEGARVFFDRIIAQYLHKGYTKNWRNAFLRFSLDLMRARASAPENAAKAKTPEGERAEVRGRGRFSFEFPRLDTMSDDELIAAAVATRIALGKSDKASERAVKIATVQKMMKSVHPGWDARKIAVESQRVVQGAQKMARQIRADLDRGVSESLVLEHLPDAMRRQFGAEMRQQARQGARLGTYRQRAATAVEERQARIVEEAVKVQSGVETKLLENAYGVDLSQTLMNLVENPFLKKDKDGNYVPAGAGKQAAEDVTGVVQEDAPQKEVEEHVRRAVDEVVKVSAKKRAEEERARRNRENAAGHDAEVEAAMAAGSGEDGEASLAGADVVDIATRREGINLEDPRQLAHFVVELSRRYWIDSHGLKNDANVWADAVAVQFLRKTAANVYGKLAADIAYSQARATAARAIDGFENVPTVQGLLSEMTYVGQVINAKKIRETQQQLCEKLDLFLREKLGAQGRFKPDNEELHRKVSAEVELRARYMRHAMWLTPDAAADEAKEIQREIDIAATDFKGEGHDVDQSRVMVEGIRKLNVLREFGALRYKPVGKIEEAIAYWEDMERGSGEEIAREALDREVRTKKAAAVLARAFHDTARKYVREGRDLGAMLGDYMQSHMGFMNLLRDMTRYASDADAQAAENVFRWLELEIQKAGTAASVEKRRHADALAQAVKQIYGRDFAKVLSEFADEDARFAPFMGTVDGQRVRPTKGRAIQLMVSLLQVGRKIEVEDPEKPGEFIVQWEGGYHDNIVKFHREAQAAQIAALLTPADLNLVKWLGQWYESNRQELSGVCESLFGIGVYAETSNYFPVKMLLEKQGLEKGDAVGWSIFPRALTPRVKNERDFDTSADVLQMFMSRMEEGAQWKAHARLGLEMRGIFGRAELQAAIAASHGNKANATVLGFVTDTLAGHGTYDRGDNGATYYTDIVRGWAALGALGANVGVMVRQPTSIPAFGFEIGLAKTAKHMLTAFTPDGMDAMRRIFDSDQRKVRWDTGNTEAVKNALASSGSGPMMRLWKASMITNKLGDVVPALVVGQGIYRECLEKGMSEEDAMAYTWMLVERTQQSSRIENQAQFQRRSKYGRAIYQFLSTQQQYLQYELRAVRAVMAKPGDASRWARLAGTVTLNHFILSSAYFWVGAMYRRLLGQEPPEDELKDWTVSMLLGPFGALYGLGLTCTGALNEWIKGPQYGGSSSLPFLSYVGNVIVRDPAAVVKAMLDEDASWDDVLEELGKWAADQNALFRDMRKIKKNYFDKD